MPTTWPLLLMALVLFVVFVEGFVLGSRRDLARAVLAALALAAFVFFVLSRR